MSKIYLKDIVPECLELHEEVYDSINRIFIDKTTEETIAALMMLSVVFEKSVEDRIGVETTKNLKEYIVNYMSE